MDMANIMYELVNTKTSLTIADRTIEALQKQNRKLHHRCLRQSLVIAGLMWVSVTACKMLGKSDKELKEAQETLREREEALAKSQSDLWNEQRDKDVCCDGKATNDNNDA